ncbi:MAG: methyltransferase, TIGR04325 family [Nitrospirota bacterium]|nr:methyltransferase, TIGR04325 family [Nitrospirota bacterium]
MNARIRSFLKKYAFPAVTFLIRKIAPGARFTGAYATWEEAQARSTGYDAPAIAKRVYDAALKVKTGEACYERDSVIFDRIQYAWPVTAGLLWIAAQRGNSLNLADFGGSLGSSYFQSRRFLADLETCRWSIVEQRHFVELGRTGFEDDHLRFYETLDDCMEKERPDVLLLSSVLPYLPHPYVFLDDIIRRGFDFIIVDRTPLFTSHPDRLTVQKVPDWIYAASFPAWILNIDRFLAKMSGEYELIADFDSPETANLTVLFKGFIFRKKASPASERLGGRK